MDNRDAAELQSRLLAEARNRAQNRGLERVLGLGAVAFILIALVVNAPKSAAPAAVAAVGPTPTATALPIVRSSPSPPTAAATPTTNPKPTPRPTPYQAVFSSIGSFSGLDPLPFVTGQAYRVEWSYDATDGPCGFAAALVTPGGAPDSTITIADEAAQGSIRSGKVALTWTGDGSEPRLVVASQCLWVITFVQAH